MEVNLSIIPTSLYQQYCNAVQPLGLESLFNSLTEAEISTTTYSFYTSGASVFSSKIEGEDIELDSYIKHKKYGIQFIPDYTRKIDDLYNAYTFGKTNKLNQQNIAEAHCLLSMHLLAKPNQGVIRTQNMYISTSDGLIEYVAATPYELLSELEKLYADIDLLLHSEMDMADPFFYASLIHLVFVKIHHFNNSNVRTVRLLEKWFLAQKLGEKAWFIQSEKAITSIISSITTI